MAPKLPSTNPLTTVPIDSSTGRNSPDGPPSVKTVDSNDNPIHHTSCAGTERVITNLVDAMEGEVQVDNEGKDTSDYVPAVDINWDDYTYESAAEEEKSARIDDLSPIRPPPQDLFPTSEDESIAVQLQMDEYEAEAPVAVEDGTRPTQVPPSNVTAQNVYSSLESIHKDITLKMEADNKARDEHQL
jgi:hypothetical protein